MRKDFVVIITILALVFACSLRAEDAFQITEQEQECFDAINALRVKAGLQPFMFSEELSEECRKWSRNLRSRNTLYHGASFENCARGTEGGKATYRQWYNSPGHKALLLNRTGTEAGIGSDGVYWTFRVRKAPQPVKEQPVQEIPVEQESQETVVQKSTAKSVYYRTVYYRPMYRSSLMRLLR